MVLFMAPWFKRKRVKFKRIVLPINKTIEEIMIPQITNTFEMGTSCK